MNKIAAAIATLTILVFSVPAFACDGHKEAKNESSSDETVVTAGHESCDDASCDCHKAKDGKKGKKAKKAKNQSKDGEA